MDNQNQVRVTKISKKENSKVPAGAKILSTETYIDVEEIENGFLITKRKEIRYKDNTGTNWTSEVTKYYSKTDVVEVKTKDKSLAEIFENEQ